MTMNGIVAKTGRLLSQTVNAFVANRHGSTAIEYALIVSLIFLAIVASVRAFSNTTSDMYTDVSSAMTSTN